MAIGAFAPNDGTGIQAPLAVGKTWSIKSTDVNRVGGFSWKRSGTSKVAAKESITTQAGTFDAFKIERVATGHPTRDPSHMTEITQQTWYAPAIDHWMKRVFVSRMDKHLRAYNTVELVDYGRKQ
jgi:hypothetical protein